MEFVQERITTLHDFGEVNPTVALDSVAVVVPIAGADTDRASVRRTLRIAARHEPGAIVLPVRGDRAAARRVQTIADDLPVATAVIWCNAPEMEDLLSTAGIDPSGAKGFDVWLGLAVATAEHEHVVVHDADATSYTHQHLPRLVWPLTHGHSFVKAYYARVEQNQLYGRLLRLFWSPLVAAIDAEYDAPVIDYLSAFRYPLAGEFAMTASVAQSMSLPREFGLEIGVLGESHRVAGEREAAQVDLGWHRHDHRPVTGPNGLVPMARAIAGTIEAVLDADDIPIDLAELQPEYRARANRLIEQYAADADFNGLAHEEADERNQVDQYAQVLIDPDHPEWLPPLSSVSFDVEEVRAAGAPARSRALDTTREMN